MEKKATRRIIGILVIVALIIILLPLFNSTESQTNLQTAEIKAPPFPDSQTETNPANADTSTTVAQNNSSSLRTWFQKIMTPQAEQPAAAPGPDKTVVTAQSTIQPTIVDDQGNAEANAGTITPPKQDTLIANSAADGEEDVEQGTMNNNVTVSDTDNAATNKAPKVPSGAATPTQSTTTSNATPNSQTTAKSAPATQSAAQPLPTPTQIPVKPITSAATDTPKGQPLTTAPTSNKPVVIEKPTQPAKPATAASSAPTITPVMSKAAPEPLAKTLADVNKIAATAQMTTPPAPNDVEKKAIAKATIAPVTSKNIEQKKPIQTAKATIPAPAVNVEQLKKSAWVVQIGSFKSKINAENLTNALRAKGFKAFTYATKSNGQTRVYIGPEFKQGSALALASKVQSAVNIHGIVVPYKPLEL
jgi:cell division septation protein DedD